MNLTIQKVIALIIACGMSGGLGGYYAASFSPVQGQVAIVDVQALLKQAIDKNQAQTEADAKTSDCKNQGSDSAIGRARDRHTGQPVRPKRTGGGLCQGRVNSNP